VPRPEIDKCLQSASRTVYQHREPARDASRPPLPSSSSIFFSRARLPLAAPNRGTSSGSPGTDSSSATARTFEFHEFQHSASSPMSHLFQEPTLAGTPPGEPEECARGVFPCGIGRPSPRRPEFRASLCARPVIMFLACIGVGPSPSWSLHDRFGVSYSTCRTAIRDAALALFRRVCSIVSERGGTLPSGGCFEQHLGIARRQRRLAHVIDHRPDVSRVWLGPLQCLFRPCFRLLLE